MFKLFGRRTIEIQGAKPGAPPVRMNGSDFKAGRKYEVVGDIVIVGDTPRLASLKVQGSLTHGRVNAPLVYASENMIIIKGTPGSGSLQAVSPVRPRFAFVAKALRRRHGVAEAPPVAADDVYVAARNRYINGQKVRNPGR